MPLTTQSFLLGQVSLTLQQQNWGHRYLRATGRSHTGIRIGRNFEPGLLLSSTWTHVKSYTQLLTGFSNLCDS